MTYGDFTRPPRSDVPLVRCGDCEAVAWRGLATIAAALDADERENVQGWRDARGSEVAGGGEVTRCGCLWR